MGESFRFSEIGDERANFTFFETRAGEHSDETRPYSMEVVERMPHPALADAREHLPLGQEYRWALRRGWLRPGGDRASLPAGVPGPVVLFNIVVALEWSPGPDYLGGLCKAFEEAAKLLFDVTDGYMVIEQVVIGGMELMRVADIQVFASNRLLPRSHVSALFKKEISEYRPIRLGRGLWSKREHKAIPWEKGSGVLVHEWGHYALGLRDQYLNKYILSGSGRTLVVPGIGLTVDSIMARSMGPSEITGPELWLRKPVAPPRSTPEWGQLANNPEFGFLAIDPSQHPQEDAPAVRPRPAFRIPANGRADEEEITISFSGARPFSDTDPDALDKDHCWVYVLRGSEGRPIAQGTIDKSAWTEGFRLLGARVGDVVVLLGCQCGTKQPAVWWGGLAHEDENGTRISHWDLATPQTWPLIAVVPERKEGTPCVRVEIVTGDEPDNVEVFPLGDPAPAGRVGDPAPTDRRDKTFVVPSLEGIVLLRWMTDGRERLALCHYSEGGSADGGYPVHPNPLPSGSGEGNALLFFHDDSVALGTRGSNPSAGRADRGKYRIVTTTNYYYPPHREWLEPRSYVFGVAGDRPLENEEEYAPTLVLFFDEETPESPSLYRREGAGWVPIEAQPFPEQSYVASPLSLRSSPEPQFFRLLRDKGRSSVWR